MSALADFLFPFPRTRRGYLDIVRWWEGRRLRYNLIVGTAGLVSCAVMVLFDLLPPRGKWIFPPGRVIVVYALLANLCYTSGAVLESLMRFIWGDDAPPAGPVLFRQGLAFSVGLTLLPTVLAALFWLLRLVGIAHG